MNVLFIDTDCPEAMTSRDLGSRPMGGTESTLFRVSDQLAKDGWMVTIAQHNRTKCEVSDSGVQYLPFSHRSRIFGPDPDAIVVLRNFKILPGLRKYYPQSKFYLWMHCFPGSRWKKSGLILKETGTTVVTVSETLRDEMIEFLQPPLTESEARQAIVSIYNPIADELAHPRRPAKVDDDKMIYFSSPHKGLAEVLGHFERIRSEFPKMELSLADPGYWKGPRPDEIEGVKSLGPLCPEKLYHEVASSLCVFYPQTSFAETFGLVFAEANSLGTPVLAHDLGAAREILAKGGEGQLIDCHDHNEVLETIRFWRNLARPEVSRCPEFSLDAVTLKWKRLLGSPRSPDIS